jgi:hypothetical protein
MIARVLPPHSLTIVTAHIDRGQNDLELNSTFSLCPSSGDASLLEALSINLSLGSSNGSRRFGVNKAASCLAILELGRLGGADTNVAGIRTTRRGAVSVVYTSSCDEL